MNLFLKIDSYIDYNNHYSIKKGLETLRQEFEKAVKTKNPEYAREIVITLKKIYDKLYTIYRQSEDYGETMSFSQRMMSIKMQEFLHHLTKRLKKEFKIVAEVVNENPS